MGAVSHTQSNTIENLTEILKKYKNIKSDKKPFLVKDGIKITL